MHPTASLPPQLPGSRGAGRPEATLQEDAGLPTPRGPGSRCGYLLSADRPAAHGKRRTYGSPRPDKGVPADPEGRALAARGLGPSPRARARSGPWRRRRTWSTRGPWPRPVGSVRPATSAGATAASSSCGGRHVPSPARAPATPTPGPAYGPPRPGTPRIPPPPPSERAPCPGSTSLALAGRRLQRREARSLGMGDSLGVRRQTAQRANRDYILARRRTRVGMRASMTPAGKGP